MSTRFTGNPNARPRVAHETVSRLDTFIRRLRQVGATEDDIDQMREVWDDPDGWVIPRDTLMQLSDVDLRKIIDAGNRELYEHTHTPDEELAERRAGAYSYARAEWDGLLKPVKASEVGQWVGTDPVRAAVALEAENEGQQRVTVLRFLEPLADPDPVPAPAATPASVVHALDGDERVLCDADVFGSYSEHDSASTDDAAVTCDDCLAQLAAIAAAAADGGIEL